VTVGHPGPAAPRYSFTAYCTPHNTAFYDIEHAVAIGADGIGLSELKLQPGQDEQVREAMEQAGLTATFCVPQSHTLLGTSFGRLKGASLSLHQRIDLIGTSIERLARFDPVAIVVAPGATGDPQRPAGPVEDVVEALPLVADIAAEFDQTIAFELLGQRRGSAVYTIPDMVEIMVAANRPNIGLALDVFHSWPEQGLEEHLRDNVEQVICAQVCDVRFEERGGLDREMPGLGRGVAVPWVTTLLDAGYDGWWEFEVFSDDGTYGNDYLDSYWKMPHLDFLRMGKEHFDRVWATAVDAVTARRDERQRGAGR
jgi:sugar phosphate isomerase/epimerase